MSSYRKKIIKPKNLIKMKKLYESLESKEERIKQFYNLFYCYKRNIPNDQHIIVDGLDNDIHSQYFLRYEEGSFTRRHTDNDQEVGETAISLIDSDNLEGGDIIVYEPHYKNTSWEVTQENKTLNYYKEEYAPGAHIIPEVVKQDVGETVIYSHKTMHSVSRVSKGTRIVLVTWYNIPKKVLLVGNGTSILDKELGEKIDSFDTVVRFNSYTTKGYEKYTGTKTDIWFTCMDKHLKNINDYKQVIVHNWFNESNCNLFNKLKNKRSDITKVSTINYHELKAPSTGLIAIDYFLNDNYEVYLHGFDWWDREKHHYADEEIRGELHEPKEEYKIIKNLGDKVKFIK